MRLLQCFLFSALAVLSFAQERVDEDMNAIIRKHGVDQSHVMEIASWITDVFGPRLTGSPQLDKATEWAVSALHSWGMKNVHLEEWGPFGRGWQLEHFELHANSGGSYWPVLGYPKVWSPSAAGEGEVIYLNIQSEKDLKSYEGKLAGKFVMMDTIREVSEHFDALAERNEAEDLLKLANRGVPTPRPRRNYTRNTGGFDLNRAIWDLLDTEQPLAILDRSYKGDLGTVFVQGARGVDRTLSEEEDRVIPQITLSVEQYNRILRLLNKNIKTTLSVDLQARATNEDGMEHNVIAEIPGTDLKDEVVMFGAHFDSWHTSTGATDNGAGSAVMMEVARILLETIRESGIQPRRTLRLALWTGEEQGLLGSRGYVGTHFAEFAPGSWTPQSLKPEQEKVSAYYNLDNGTGKVRGIYTQGNQNVVEIFRDLLDPFHNDGAATVSLGNTGGTDHVPFDGVGIPAFQFIQDPIAYSSRTHHSNMDCWDHFVADDLKQAATIIASFVWHTSQRDEKLPRKSSADDSDNER